MLRPLVIAGFLASLIGCNPAPDAADLEGTRGGRVDVFFNEPGTRRENMWEPDAVKVMVELIDNAKANIDFAVMGFGRQEVIDAMIRAHDRGVRVRMVGDAGHLYNSGYRRFIEREIPIVVGNEAHIMHDKFMVVDDRFVFGGTANWTDTDLRHNSNNFFLMDSAEVANDFSTEFEQMFAGAFGHLKVEIFNGREYRIGDTIVEVWFSPNEDAMGRILELVDASEESIRFTIFAFTKDQVGSAYIRKQAEFREKDAAEGVPEDADFRDRRSVAGLIDKSQLHSNGQYHEIYRLMGAQIPLRLDGNDNSKLPGDYQAGGGRMHSKTMILDAYGDNPVVISGSFNWSSSATVSNDEFLVVFRAPDDDGDGKADNNRVAALYDQYFESVWANGSEMGSEYRGENGLEAGDIVINEILWYGKYDYSGRDSSNGDNPANHRDRDGNVKPEWVGYFPEDADGFDEFIELRNMTDRDISLDMWQISNPDDFVVGFPPGSTIPAGGTFLVLDHTLEPYQDGVGQDEKSAFTNGDLVVNSFNDNRQARLYLKDGSMDLRLLDPRGNVVDRAGDGGSAFFGGPDGDLVLSMERRANPGDGTDPANWKTCQANEGGENVNVPFRPLMIATPGEPNSGQ